MKKKILSALLASAMVLSLAACGSTPASEPASGSTAASAASGSSTTSASASTESKQYIFSVDELTGKTVGVQLGTTGDIYVTENIEGAEVSRYNKGMDAALDVLNGRLDAVVIDTLPAKQFVASLAGLVVHDEILTDVEVEPYGIAVQLGQEELIEKINASLKRMQEDGTFDAILLKYVDEGDAAEGEEATDGEATDGETTETEAETAEN